MPELHVEIQLPTGWVAVTEDVREDQGVDITRGRPDEAAETDPGEATLKLNNRHGRYSPRNPASPYYGQLGRNTPIGIWVRGPDCYIRPMGGSASVASSSALDITEDLDVAVEVALWRLATQNSAFEVNEQELAGRYQITGDQRSWALLVTGFGLPQLRWSTTGADLFSVNATEFLRVRPEERFALRATLDVDNGAGQHVVTFYTAPSLDGPWRPLGEPVTVAGTTSVFNAAAPLEVGNISTLGFQPGTGLYHRFELLDGIGGPVLAEFDASTLTSGDTGFTDSVGNTWTLTSTIIRNWYPRFMGEVTAWPPSWDTSGADRWVTITAHGPLRRLGQGQKPVQSTLRRKVAAAGPLAYWPMEESAGATQAYSPIDGVAPARATGLDWGAATTLAGSAPLPVTREGAAFFGSVPAPAVAQTEWQCEFVMSIDAAPSPTSTIMRFGVAGGTVGSWWLQLGSGTARVIGLDGEGATLFDQGAAVGSDLYDGRWVRWRLIAEQVGGTVEWTMSWLHVGVGGGATSNSFTGTLGRITTAQSPQTWGASVAGMRIGHVAVFSPTQPNAFNGADDGLRGEGAVTRIRRLAAEERQALATVGLAADTEALGPQGVAPYLDLVREIAAADGGLLYELRGSRALQYMPRTTLYNRAPGVILDYAGGEVAPPLEPTDDDQGVRNDITITRQGGSSARAVLEDGPMGTAAPPAGIGVYDEAITLNVFEDEQLEGLAWWRLHHRTWDEARYPTVTINLANPRMLELRQEVLDGLDVGAALRIINAPDWLPPGPIDLAVESYAEHLDAVRWTITATCSPLGPWTVAEVAAEDPAVDGPAVRVDTAGSSLAAAVTEADTALTVAVTAAAGQPWTTDPTDWPFGILVGGEEMTVTAISGEASPQTFTVVRSANGVVKAHDAGTAVTLAVPAYVGL